MFKASEIFGGGHAHTRTYWRNVTDRAAVQQYKTQMKALRNVVSVVPAYTWRRHIGMNELRKSFAWWFCVIRCCGCKVRIVA